MRIVVQTKHWMQSNTKVRLENIVLATQPELLVSIFIAKKMVYMVQISSKINLREEMRIKALTMQSIRTLAMIAQQLILTIKVAQQLIIVSQQVLTRLQIDFIALINIIDSCLTLTQAQLKGQEMLFLPFKIILFYLQLLTQITL